ncbi:Calcineurin-like phosphoesterase superfamily domain protein [Caballeronia cordobensis]|uniref:Calcineurin-like phosphoesterase superfamily domain protein n=2 Tax=Caballeronia cordobensis TaxID=1353886 RepID=A0A158I544_CABCO|nr:Calcineurin-like phosphoesterase superfamily domain protein [Caballeronia cordobensis]
MKRVRLLHLSDIHFHPPGAIGHDPDYALREDLRLDLAAMVAARGPLDAILVTGDIAFSGAKVEYENASEWLDAMADTGGCGREMVYVCPGNHDIDREFIRKNGLVEDLHDSVRGRPSHFEREQHLMRRLEQDVARELVYSPLTEYNKFAARYDCAFFADERYAWDSDDFVLNDGSALRIRGLNSALLSGPRDAPGSLFLGAKAYTITRRAGVEYLTMCHHPPSWLIDGAEAHRSLEDRARILLFGHEHDQRIAFGRDNVVLYAGATNPARDEKGWKPGYNIIEIWVERAGDVRQLHVEVVAREWQDRPVQFRNHEDRRNRPTHVHHFELEPWIAPHASEAPAMVTPSENGGPTAEAPAVKEESPRPPAMRSILHAFFRLPISRKSEIVGKLGLLDDSETRLPEVERFKRAIERAKQQGKLETLWKMTMERGS